MRKLLIAFFAIGTVAGFGSEIAGWHHCANHRRAAFEQHVADLCVNAARNPDRASNFDDPWSTDRHERGRHGHRRHERGGPPGYDAEPDQGDR
ncbi:MAG: hypothetical protein U0165_04940 [Polyangiaceae bacterium]